MTDWGNTGASAATALGTLVLAVATFASVRSSQRSARATEAALLAGIRPVLVPSRPDDSEQAIGFIDDHWVRVAGSGAVAEFNDDTVYLAASLRNVGNGLAVLDRWTVEPERTERERSAADVGSFRRLTRDIYVAAGDTGFWQGTIRDPADPLFAAVRAAITEGTPITLDLLYGDHDGGQHTISRFVLLPADAPRRKLVASRHWNLDRPDPR